MTVKCRFLSFALLSALFLFACIEKNTPERANTLFREGKYDESLAVYDAILKKNPSDISVLKSVADIKLIKKDFSGAIQGYKKVIEVNPAYGIREMVSMLSYSKNVRDMASDVIKDIGNGKTEVINEILKRIAEGNNYVKIDHLNALTRIGRPASFSAATVAQYLDDDYFGIRKAALETLGTFNEANLKEAGVIDKMIARLHDDNLIVVEETVKSFGALKGGANETVPALIKMLTRKDEIKDLVKKVIADIGPAAKSKVPELKALTDAKNPFEIRIAAIDALAAMGSQANDAVPVLIPLLQDKNHTIKTASANALTKIGKPSNESVPELINLLNHNDADVKLRAITELSDMGKTASSALTPLSRLAGKDSNKEVRSEAKKAYDQIYKAKR
ncbi:MAG: HEAT repeat domain-containing protein [Endomicrobium sp.]|jgi:HEAT repeat protein|nr:HEAT repeat domain-containing protein [Endomicrobium sp.]